MFVASVNFLCLERHGDRTSFGPKVFIGPAWNADWSAIFCCVIPSEVLSVWAGEIFKNAPRQKLITSSCSPHMFIFAVCSLIGASITNTQPIRWGGHYRVNGAVIACMFGRNLLVLNVTWRQAKVRSHLEIRRKSRIRICSWYFTTPI